jgi:hypothetical protein
MFIPFPGSYGQDLLTDPNGAKAKGWDDFCPGGAVGLSPGFQPWETVRPKRVALKGRKIT